MLTLDAIDARTSVREFTDKEVSREQIVTLLRAAMAAPSGRNVQSWHFLVQTQKTVLQELADNLPNAPMLAHAPLAILVAADLKVADAGTPGYDYWPLDCSAATQNILLTATELNLGAVWLGVYPVPERAAAVKKILHLPEHIAPFCLTAIGTPARKFEAKKKFNEERVHWERW